MKNIKSSFNNILNIQESTLIEVNEFYKALQDYDFDADIHIQQELWYAANGSEEMPDFGELFKQVVMLLLKKAIINKAESEVSLSGLRENLDKGIVYFLKAIDGDDDACAMYINGDKVYNIEDIKSATNRFIDDVLPY